MIDQSHAASYRHRMDSNTASPHALDNLFCGLTGKKGWNHEALAIGQGQGTPC
ncbi:uncharacterized protein SETTUDRAFT_168550 [Exserohilum turcica Et28A]|uniref:Uncharacterized protein n=1 Tax=Exserohilum turcicum (strain 28A) TaxID=671987 RepID=R0K544_EXST2|nr:uncharacterized protein SETTUDRAFT_168550 [Exserohilum turcica Et28A]EOA88128.1 hypothetical protein SETTUDRAFT_168550 [Exserohilum turcica Et28A]